MIFDNVTIILQGIINPDVDLYNTLLSYTNVGHVILSIYDNIGDNSCIPRIINNFTNVRIIYNNLDEYKNRLIEINKYVENNSNADFLNNCYYQLCCTKKALDLVNTEYVVKSRVDHYYSALGDGDMIRWCISYNKILSSSIYVRPHDRVRYHLSDHLFMGKTCEINNVINLALFHYNPGCPEVNIWKPYIFDIANKEGINPDLLDPYSYAKYMASKFYIYCINRNVHYKIKVANQVLTRIKDIDKTKEDSTDYFLHGCDFL